MLRDITTRLLAAGLKNDNRKAVIKNLPKALSLLSTGLALIPQVIEPQKRHITLVSITNNYYVKGDNQDEKNKK